MKMSMKLVFQYMAISLNFSPTSNHLHPLKVDNCDSNLRLVVDEDDSGKFRLERVNNVMNDVCARFCCYSLLVLMSTLVFVITVCLFLTIYGWRASYLTALWMMSALVFPDLLTPLRQVPASLRGLYIQTLFGENNYISDGKEAVC